MVSEVLSEAEGQSRTIFINPTEEHMARPNQKKKDIVTSLTSDLKDAKSIVLADYRGMTMKQFEDLRKTLRSVNAKFIVAKNTLLKISLTKI